jgi:hypothetical protein
VQLWVAGKLGQCNSRLHFFKLTDIKTRFSPLTVGVSAEKRVYLEIVQPKVAPTLNTPKSPVVYVKLTPYKSCFSIS